MAKNNGDMIEGHFENGLIKGKATFYPNNGTGYPQTYGAFFKTGNNQLAEINIYASVSMYVAWFVIGY